MPWACCLGQGRPKDLANDEHTINNNQCRQSLSLGRPLRRHALGMLSLAGSVPAPCERRTYTRKQNPNIFMQWGWELSQQWSSGEFRQIRVCNQKRAKGQHWATKFSWSSNLFFCRSWKSTVPLLLALGAHEGLLDRSAADYVYSLSWFNSNTLHVHWCYHDILSKHEQSKQLAVFLCTAVKLQCCHMLARWTQHAQPSPPFIQHSFVQ